MRPGVQCGCVHIIKPVFTKKRSAGSNDSKVVRSGNQQRARSRGLDRNGKLFSRSRGWRGNAPKPHSDTDSLVENESCIIKNKENSIDDTKVGSWSWRDDEDNVTVTQTRKPVQE